jgi:hypothetical protein
MPKSTVYTGKKFRLSKFSGSREVVLLCHGDWCQAYGYADVPDGMVMRFYSAHGTFGTQATSLAERILGMGSKDSPISMAEQERIMSLPAEKQEEALKEAKARVNAQGNPLSMVVEAVEGKLEVKVYDYRLAYKGPRDSEECTEGVWRRHHAGNCNGNVDLIVMKQGTDACRHLSNAIKFALSHKKSGYDVFHFLPCRYVDKDDAESMKTVNLPKFTGEFKVVNLLHDDD